jgi:hypothetical protein
MLSKSKDVSSITYSPKKKKRKEKETRRTEGEIRQFNISSQRLLIVDKVIRRLIRK